MNPIKLIIKTKTQKYPIIIGSNLTPNISKIANNNTIKFNLLYDKNRSLQKKIKIEQTRNETR